MIWDDPRWTEVILDDLRWSQLISSDLGQSPVIKGDLNLSQVFWTALQKSVDIFGDFRSSQVTSGDVKSCQVVSLNIRWCEVISAELRWSYVISRDHSWSLVISDNIGGSQVIWIYLKCCELNYEDLRLFFGDFRSSEVIWYQKISSDLSWIETDRTWSQEITVIFFDIRRSEVISGDLRQHRGWSNVISRDHSWSQVLWSWTDEHLRLFSLISEVDLRWSQNLSQVWVNWTPKIMSGYFLWYQQVSEVISGKLRWSPIMSGNISKWS